MSKNSKVVDRKSFCKDVVLHVKWHNTTVAKAVTARRDADANAARFTLQTCRRWVQEYIGNNKVFDYDNAVAVSK